ncbi:uncharacterized protein LOC124361549 [Homalodisca vitripennis]|uniref:uncharacterized protein LOC124361549 n=1 Tax=Homalodisca vitripennis TaxID=197043 RepID=UPI001EE9E0B3|nr:uncharacterized protein LOC124361549 [Homalodisca vitripennis]
MNLIKVFLIAWLIETTRTEKMKSGGEYATVEVRRCLRSGGNICYVSDFDRKRRFDKMRGDTQLQQSQNSLCSFACNNVTDIVKEFNSKHNEYRGKRCANYLNRIVRTVCTSKDSSCVCTSMACTLRSTICVFSRERRVREARRSIKISENDNDFSSKRKTNESGYVLRKKLSFSDDSTEDLDSVGIIQPVLSDITLPAPEALSGHDHVIQDHFEQEILETENISVILTTEELNSNSVAFDEIVSVISDMKLDKEIQTRSSSQGSAVVDGDQSNRSDLIEVFRSRYPVEEWKSLGLFTEDYLHLIDKHWLQFSPPRHSSHYILAGLYTLVMTVGVTGNCLVIFMFLR